MQVTIKVVGDGSGPGARALMIRSLKQVRDELLEAGAVESQIVEAGTRPLFLGEIQTAEVTFA